MKARYFRDESIFDVTYKRHQSYGWSSILAGLSLLKKGTRYLVGDGKTIRLGNDNVVPDHPPRPVTSLSTSSYSTISDLITN